jgi:two-component system, NarL family, sensor histidine kinase DegS
VTSGTRIWSPGRPGVLLWNRLVGERVRERPFWAIQAMVAAVTGLHALAEAFDWFAGELWLAVGLHHFPVILYVVPLVYAALRYGFEGAALTGAWCVVLSMPNVFLWHAESYLWAGELLYVAAVVTVALVVAVPVERDRRHRRRLEILHDVTAALVAAPLDQALPRLLDRIQDALHLEGAGVVSPHAGGVCTATPPDRTEQLERLAPEALEGLAGHRTAPSENLVAVRLAEAPSAGALVVWTGQGGLDRHDRVLLASVARQVGLALENRHLERQAEQRLRSYVQGVTRAQEEERRRIALELHDTTAQDLVRVCRGLDALSDADGLRELAQQTLEGLRRLSRDLRPTVLDDLGLAPALEWLTADLSERDVAARCLVVGTVRRLPPDTELVLFRVAQEALRNVEKHAGATRADVDVQFADGHVRVLVSDDGRGIRDAGPPDQLVRVGKLGLAGMHERAELVGARLLITNRPEGGTAVEIRVEDQETSMAMNRPEGTSTSAV